MARDAVQIHEHRPSVVAGRIVRAVQRHAVARQKEPARAISPSVDLFGRRVRAHDLAFVSHDLDDDSEEQQHTEEESDPAEEVHHANALQRRCRSGGEQDR
jgi:hypothetical protein